ncbi:MAG: type III secretion protein [Waddliaceae bacterium]
MFTKVLYLNILAFFWIQNAFFAEPAPSGRSADLEHLWSIAEENPKDTGQHLRDVLKKKKEIPQPAFVDRTEGSREETWNDFSEPELPGTFIPTPWEALPPDAGEEKRENKQGKANLSVQSPTASPSEIKPNSSSYPELFFPIEKEHSQESIQPSSKQAVQYHPVENLGSEDLELMDPHERPWITTFHDPFHSEETSQQKEDASSTASLNQQEKGMNHSPATEDATAENPPSDKAIGQSRVAVDSYYLAQGKPPNKRQHKQSFSAQKAPYTPPRTQGRKKGIFGPAIPAAQTPERSVQEKKDQDSKRPPLQSPPQGIIAQIDESDQEAAGQRKTPPKTILINFNNVSIIEYLRFISRLTDKNFIFDENDLQFNVTIISEEPTTLENVITALIQELRIHNLSLIEHDNNFIIHKNDEVNSISRVNTDGTPSTSPRESELVTQVFRLNTLDPTKASQIINPLLSKQALMETAEETMHLIITDIVTNIEQIGILLKALDAPSGGLVIGQYVVRSSFMDTLIELAKQIMEPIAQGQTLTFVPHPEANSIFIVSSPFLVERTISVLHHLDYFRGTTRIYDLDDLKLERLAPVISPPGVPSPEEGAPLPDITLPGQPGRWELNPAGNWIFRPARPTAPERPGEEAPVDVPPRGNWRLDPQNNWHFIPEGATPAFRPRVPGEDEETEGLAPGTTPRGRWVLDPNGDWIFQLSPGEPIQPAKMVRPPKVEEVTIPVGAIERTKFFIYKLEFCRGAEVIDAMQRIGDSLTFPGTVNQDLLLTIQSAQWLEGQNAIVFTGTEESLDKVSELVKEIDRPVRQVFIEMLILQTSITDSLTYGVSWATESGGGQTATSQGFFGSRGVALRSALINTTGIDATPNASSLLPVANAGYTLGLIGQRITKNGQQFASLGLLIDANHNIRDIDIVLNPKIIAEDNKTAEIFVGQNTRFQTQAVANDEGQIITTNFEFRDVGTTLRVTPHICHDNLITLDIEQEVSSIAPGQVQAQQANQIDPGPTTNINRTTTTVHVPDEYFVVISGLLNDSLDRSRTQIPCLGGIPVLGAAFSSTTTLDGKQNLMIFIRPQIIDTVEEINSVTKQQQNIIRQKKCQKSSWKYEVDDALEWLNIRTPCYDECPLR